MVKRPRTGSLTTIQEQLLPLSFQRCQSESRATERIEISSSTRLQHNGSNPSSTSMRTWRTPEDLSLKLLTTSVPKVVMSFLGRSITVRIRDGLSSTERTMDLTSKPKERTNTMVLNITCHSMLSTRVRVTKSIPLRLLEEETLLLRDSRGTSWPNNST